MSMLLSRNNVRLSYLSQTTFIGRMKYQCLKVCIHPSECCCLKETIPLGFAVGILKGTLRAPQGLKSVVLINPPTEFQNFFCTFCCIFLWSLSAKSHLCIFKTVGGEREVIDRQHPYTPNMCLWQNFCIIRNLTCEFIVYILDQVI